METDASLRILFVEDVPLDAELAEHTLRKEGLAFTSKLVDTKEAFLKALKTFRPDLVISDYSMPEFDGMKALELSLAHDPDLPFLILTGSINEETAVECLKAGACDYVIKQHISRLAYSVKEALERTGAVRAKVEAEAALRESEEIFRKFMEFSPIYVFFKDENIRALRLSKNFETWLGKPVAELLGKTMDDLFPSELAKSMIADDKRILKEGKGIMVEEELNGRLYTTIKFPVILEGKPPYLAGYTIDITERKLIEASLRASEERHRTLFETMQQGVVYQDADGAITHANPAAQRILGLTLDQMQGRDSMDPRWRSIHEDGSDLPGQEHPAMVALRTGKPVTDVIMGVFNPADEGYHWIMVSAIPQFKENEDQPYQVFATFTDITERKRAEEALRESDTRYRTIFEGTMEGILVAEIEAKKFRYANPAICKMLQYSADEILEMSVLDIHPKGALNDVIAEFEAQARGEKILAAGLPCLRKDGTVIYADVSSSTVILDGVSCNVGFFTDITERRSLEAQLHQAMKMEAIGRLAGGVAHDFNNLLTVILGRTELVEMTLDPRDPMHKDIEEVKSAAEKAAALTRQLLAFSRKQALEPKQIDLNALMTNLDKMLRRIIGEDMNMKMILGTDLWKVQADPGQIEQVIINLAVNARDAMPKGGMLTLETVNVELDETYARTHPGAEPRPYVMLAVSDTGCGMTAELQTKIFEPFFTTKGEGKGTGLGLSTVYGIVKQSGGHIWVYSEPGAGTTFKVYLPRDTSGEKAVKATVKKKEGTHGGNERILVVEDEEAVRVLAVKLLKKLGYDVLEAISGGNAYLMCRQMEKPVDLILSDVIMPDMNGADFMSLIHKEIWPNVKVLFMSGYTANAIVHNGVLDPDTPYLPKPFGLDALSQKVREVLDS